MGAAGAQLVVPVWRRLVVGAALVPIAQIASPGTLPNTLTPAALAGAGSDDAARPLSSSAALAAGAARPVRAAASRLDRRRSPSPSALGAPLRRLRPPDRRHVGTRGAWSAIGLGAARLARRRGLRRCDALVTGDRLWTATARTVFWNRAIDEAIRSPRPTSRSHPSRRSVEVEPRRVLRRADGAPLERDVVVAPVDRHARGREARRAPRRRQRDATASPPGGPERAGTDAPSHRAASSRTATSPGTATVTVYACRPGTLDVTILGKTGDPIEARVDGVPVARLETPDGERSRTGSPAPRVRRRLTALRLRAREPGLRRVRRRSRSPRSSAGARALAGQLIVGLGERLDRVAGGVELVVGDEEPQRRVAVRVGVLLDGALERRVDPCRVSRCLQLLRLGRRSPRRPPGRARSCP